MNSQKTFVIIGLTVLAIGTGAYFLNFKKAPLQNINIATTTTPTTIDETQSEDTQNSSRYITFTKNALETVATPRRVLFFYANWCPTCRPADTSFIQNSSKIPSDVTVVRVNYNDTETDADEKELARKYGVTYQHTFVQIDAQGTVVTIWNGGRIDDLLKNLK